MHMISNSVPNVFSLKMSWQIPCIYSNNGNGKALDYHDWLTKNWLVLSYFLHCSSGGLSNWAENWTKCLGRDRLLWGCLASGLTLHALSVRQVLSHASACLFWLGHETSIIFVSDSPGTFLLIISILHPAGSLSLSLAPFSSLATLTTDFLALTIDGNTLFVETES